MRYVKRGDHRSRARELSRPWPAIYAGASRPSQKATVRCQNRWWKANERGYTESFDAAGIYPMERAIAIAQRANYYTKEPKGAVVPCEGRIFVIGGDVFTAPARLTKNIYK